MPKKCIYLDAQVLKVITHRANKLGQNFSEYIRTLVQHGLEVEYNRNQVEKTDRFMLQTVIETLMLCRHLLPTSDEEQIATFSQQAKALTRQLLDETHRPESE